MRTVWLSFSIVAANGFLVRPPSALSINRPSTSQQSLTSQPRPRRLKLSLESGSTPGVSTSYKDGLVIGLNKYSHDSSVCILSNRDGSCLFAGEKERITRSKHDGGDTGSLVAHALDSIGARLEDVRLVVSNNHHFRVAPFEKRIPWAVAQGACPESYACEENLLPGAAHAELSHHLAHAWSAAALAPFDSGLIIVMDGMGESHGAMARSEAAAMTAAGGGGDWDTPGGGEQEDQQPQERIATQEEYYNDLRLMRELGAGGEMAEGTEVPGDGSPGFQQVPEELLPYEAYREAESAYQFTAGSDGGPPTLTPIYKRWTKERSPSELYNHGFENMESMGAAYSRVSSHIFGDWNACGKVMGLAPYASASDSTYTAEILPPPRLTSGSLLLGSKSSGGSGEDAFHVDWETVDSLPHPNELGKGHDRGAGDDGGGGWGGAAAEGRGLRGLRSFYAALASRAQEGLEEAALDFVSGLRERTGEKNVCLCGGVALNSVLNGKIAREAGFERVFVPPCPGDEGVAVGCAAFGWHQRRLLLPPRPSGGIPNSEGGEEGERERGEEQDSSGGGVAADAEGRNAVRSPGAKLFGSGALRTPFWGRGWTEEDIDDEIAEWDRWVECRDLEDVEEIAQAIADGQVVAWFQGRGEFGPRALGSRSLLADPRDAGMPARINADVKKREDFRPFAPSVLAEEADEWFEGIPPDGSPYMSVTVPAKAGVAKEVPAVCHIDGSSRLQTVDKESTPLYHRLISAFFKITGVPMVLNTSFNVMGEPIVDSPQDAIRSLVESAGSIGMLVLQDRVVTAKPFPPDGASEAAVAAAESGGEDGHDEYDQEELWSGMMPVQAVRYRSEVTETDGGEVLRVRVQPADGQDKWIELDETELDLLELAGRSLSLAEMMEEVLEERLSERDDDDYDDDDDYVDDDDDDDYAGYDEHDEHEDVHDDEEVEDEEEEEEEGEEEVDEEDMERLAVEAVTEDVLTALRSLYLKRLIAFETE